ITQGITTEVTGEGGSVAPLTDRLVIDDSDAMKKWHYRGLARLGRLLRAAREARDGAEHRDVRGGDPGTGGGGGQGRPTAHRRRARAHGGHRGYADAAGGAGLMDGARIRTGELLEDRGDHRAGQGGAAAWRHLRVPHAERGRADR